MTNEAPDQSPYPPDRVREMNRRILRGELTIEVALRSGGISIEEDPGGLPATPKLQSSEGGRTTTATAANAGGARAGAGDGVLRRA